MHEMQLYGSEQFGEMRTLMQDGEPWFVAADVCRALDLTDTNMALKRLDDDEKGTSLICTLGGKQNMTIINEPGLYALVLGSRKPEARAFKRWVTHEVLPAIRRNGAYLSGAALNDPEMTNVLLEAMARVREENRMLRRAIASGNGKDAAQAALYPENGCRAFLKWIRERTESGEMRLISPRDEEAACPCADVLGYEDEKYLYLIPGRVLDAGCEGRGFPTEEKALYKLLKKNGYVCPDSQWKSTRTKIIGGKSMRLLWVPKRKL